MTDTADQVLSAAQLARIACLRAAREVLVAKTTTGGTGVGTMFQSSATRTTAADPIDLVQLARYVELGIDPYEVVRSETVS